MRAALRVQFERWSGRILVVAKFVPGLSTVAPPLAGAIGLPVPLFLLLDGLASLLWAATPVALAYLFAAQMDSLLAALAGAGSAALELMLASFAPYVVVKCGDDNRRSSHCGCRASPSRICAA